MPHICKVLLFSIYTYARYFAHFSESYKLNVNVLACCLSSVAFFPTKEFNKLELIVHTWYSQLLQGIALLISTAIKHKKPGSIHIVNRRKQFGCRSRQGSILYDVCHTKTPFISVHYRPTHVFIISLTEAINQIFDNLSNCHFSFSPTYIYICMLFISLTMSFSTISISSTTPVDESFIKKINLKYAISACKHPLHLLVLIQPFIVYLQVVQN